VSLHHAAIALQLTNAVSNFLSQQSYSLYTQLNDRRVSESLKMPTFLQYEI